MDTEKGRERSTLADRDNQRMILGRLYSLTGYQDGLLADSWVPVYCIRWKITMECPVDPYEEFNSRKRIPPAEKKVIIRGKSLAFKNVFPEFCQFGLRRFDIIRNNLSPSEFVH